MAPSPPYSSSAPSGPGSSKSTTASSTAGVPYSAANLRVDEWYIVVGQTLFPLEYFLDKDLPAGAEQIHVLSNQTGRLVLEQDPFCVTKWGAGIRQSEERAMRLVSQHTSIPISKVLDFSIKEDSGRIDMTRIPGTPLNRSWSSLSDETKTRVCRQTWSLLAQLQNIPRPPECEGLFQCYADGSVSNDPLLEDLDQPPQKHLYADEELRARIYERYLHCGGCRYENQLPDMLPRSSRSVFTHADIAPRNIMVDDDHNITGILDWEAAGWYPDYWEYSQMFRPADEATREWQKWMDLTAPRKWDLSGLMASRKVLF